MARPDDQRGQRLDDAARAGWLYFIAGNTQDEIATKLDLSRQAVQRLVALAVAEKLIQFRLNHPIAACMDLAARVADRFKLEICDVAPSDPAHTDSFAGIAMATAIRMERLLASPVPIVLGVGTGRTLRLAVECMDTAVQPQHKIVSLVGSMAADGHASSYDAVMRLADRIGGQGFPLPTPVLTETVEDLRALQAQRAYAVLGSLREQAKASFVGCSEIAWGGPVHKDGFMTDSDIASLLEQGAVGEITGWAYDHAGTILRGPVSERIASLPLEQPPRRATFITACGPRKQQAIISALKGKLANGLITDEITEQALLER